MSFLIDTYQPSHAEERTATRQPAQLPVPSPAADRGRLISSGMLLGLQEGDGSLSNKPLTAAEKLLVRTQLLADDLTHEIHPEHRHSAYEVVLAPFIHAATRLPSRQQEHIIPALLEVIQIARSGKGTALKMLESIALNTHHGDIPTPAMEVAHTATRQIARHFPLNR